MGNFPYNYNRRSHNTGHTDNFPDNNIGSRRNIGRSDKFLVNNIGSSHNTGRGSNLKHNMLLEVVIALYLMVTFPIITLNTVITVEVIVAWKWP